MSNILTTTSLDDLIFGEKGFFGNLVPRSGVAPINLRKNENGSITIDFDLPGFTKEEIDVSFDAGVLTVTGHKDVDEESSKNGWIVKERKNNRVSRSVSLPETADVDNISADLSNGVLTITVPVLEKALPTKINVRELTGSKDEHSE